jgi:hypothetical protein
MQLAHQTLAGHANELIEHHLAKRPLNSESHQGQELRHCGQLLAMH